MTGRLFAGIQYGLEMRSLLPTMLLAGLALSQAPSSSPVNVYRGSDLKIVDGPRVESVTDNSAVIAWSTDVESSAVGHFGTDKANLDKKALDKWGGQKMGSSVVHRVAVRDLKPNTKYFFEV